MKTKKLLWAALSMTAALMMTACSSDDNDTTEAPVAPSTTKTIPYTVTVGGDKATTRATVDSDNKTLRFATGDKLYVWGEKIKGVLDITDGVGSTDNATFSGELTYSGSGTPAADLELNAILVSAQQKDGEQIDIRDSWDENGDVTVLVALAPFCSSVSDAVQQYSELRGTSTYGARAFTLTQQTAFLNFEITIDADPDEEAYAEVYNDNDLLGYGDVPIVTEGGVKKAKFVLPVFAGTELSNAWVKIDDTAPIPFGTDGLELKGKVYNVKGTARYQYTLADAWEEGATVTVYFRHGGENSCTFYNTGDYGEDMFEYVEGKGGVGTASFFPRQLIIDEDDENILIFKQNYDEGFGYVGDIDENWEQNGFQVTFNKETKTYTQWYGPALEGYEWDYMTGEHISPYFIKLEVNGCDVTSELTEVPLE